MSVLAFFLTFLLYTTRENEKEKRLILEEKNTILIAEKDTLVRSKSTLEGKVATLEGNEKEINRKLAKLEQENNAVTIKYKVLRSEKDEVVAMLTDIKADLKAKTEIFNDFKTKTSGIVRDFKTKNDKLSAYVGELELRLQSSGTVFTPLSEFSNKVSFEATIPALTTIEPLVVETIARESKLETKDVELPKVVVTPEFGELTGKIIVVNKKYKFFICSLGRKDNLSIGDHIGVFRNNEMLVSAKVEKIYDNISACGLTDEIKGDTIKEGDIIKVRK